MRIDISNSVNLNREKLRKLDSLKKGDVVKARVMEVKNGIARLDLGNGEVIEGKLDMSSNLLEGKLVNFLIKDTQGSILHMTPVYEDMDFTDDFVLKNEDVIMDRILNLSNLSKDEKNLNIIKNMISYKMPLKPEGIEVISRYTDKIISLLELAEGEEVQTPITDKPLDENVSKLIKVVNAPQDENLESTRGIENNKLTDLVNKITENSQASKVQQGNVEANAKGDESQVNTDRNDAFKQLSLDFLKNQNLSSEALEDDAIPGIIKNSEMENSKNITEFKDILSELESERGSTLEFKQITEQIKHEMKNIFPRSTTPDEIIQKLTFLVKSDIDVTINNLSRLTDFLQNNQTLNSEMEEVLDLAVKEGIIDERTKFELLDKTKTIDLKFDGKDQEKLKEFYKGVEEVSERLLAEISSSSKSSKELKTATSKLSDSIDFYNKINDQSTMMLIPFTLNSRQVKNSLYVLSKRKVAKRSDNIKVYMALDTSNLEKVKILCDFSYDRLNVNFKVKQEYMDLFESTKSSLQKILQDNGYEDTFIYVNKEEEENVLDLISYDDKINYMLNIKV